MQKCNLNSRRRQMTQRAARVFLAFSRSGLVFPQTIVFFRETNLQGHNLEVGGRRAAPFSILRQAKKH